MYSVRIKIDETLPWIELKGTYPTKTEARKAAKETIKKLQVKVSYVPIQGKPLSPLATIKTH